MKLPTLNKDGLISSDDLYRMVNLIRVGEGESKIRRNKFNEKLVDELEGMNYTKSVVTNRNATKSDIYLITLEQATLVGMRESRAVRRNVLAKLKQLEELLARQQGALLARNDARLEAPFLTDAIKLTRQDEGKETRHYHYTNEFDMLNRLVLGMSAKQYKEAHGIDKNSPLRDHLTEGQMTAIAHLQRSNTGMIEAGLDYATRKQKLDRLFVSRYSKMLFDEIKRLEF